MVKSRAAVNIEYGALRFFCALVNIMPYPVAMAAARGLAGFLFHTLSKQSVQPFNDLGDRNGMVTGGLIRRFLILGSIKTAAAVHIIFFVI